jgi:hypothetical protein
MYRQMIGIIPRTQDEIHLLEVGAGIGDSTSRFRDELRNLDFKFFLDVHEYNEYNRFYLSMIVSPMQLFITSLENIPPKKYDVILLTNGIRDPKHLFPLVHDSSIIIIRYPKMLKRFLESYFICSLSNENHWYFGVYRCYLKKASSSSSVIYEEPQAC